MKAIAVRLSDEDLALLQRMTRSQPDCTIATICREIIGNYCSDKRMAKRLSLPAHHYSVRHADDYSEVE